MSPGSKIHALIIGISSYPNLPPTGAALGPPLYGMNQLECAALSAFKFKSWLTDPSTRLPLPLGNIQSFFMPSTIEIEKEPQLAGQKPFGLKEIQIAAKRFRTDASQDRDSITYFFFAGHGVQRTIGDSVLILPEFADTESGGGTLSTSVDMNTLFYGMAPSNSRPNIARTQLYFVDACRVQPEEFLKFESIVTAPLFDIEKSSRDDRSAPVFYAAIPGTVANGRGGALTYFTQALLQCLTGAAGIALRQTATGAVPWSITVHSLSQTIQYQTDAFNLKYGDQQEYQPGGIMKDHLICNLSGPPNVEVKVEIEPDVAADVGSLNVLDSTNISVWTAKPVRPNPYPKSLPAGLYTLSLSFANHPTFHDSAQMYDVTPPEFEMKLRC